LKEKLNNHNYSWKLNRPNNHQKNNRGSKDWLPTKFALKLNNRRGPNVRKKKLNWQQMSSSRKVWREARTPNPSLVRVTSVQKKRSSKEIWRSRMTNGDIYFSGVNNSIFVSIIVAWNHWPYSEILSRELTRHSKK